MDSIAKLNYENMVMNLNDFQNKKQAQTALTQASINGIAMQPAFDQSMQLQQVPVQFQPLANPKPLIQTQLSNQLQKPSQLQQPFQSQVTLQTQTSPQGIPVAQPAQLLQSSFQAPSPSMSQLSNQLQQLFQSYHSQNSYQQPAPVSQAAIAPTYYEPQSSYQNPAQSPLANVAQKSYEPQTPAPVQAPPSYQSQIANQLAQSRPFIQSQPVVAAQVQLSAKPSLTQLSVMSGHLRCWAGDYMPVEGNRSKFYRCSANKLIEFSCPSGTVWIYEQRTCDHSLP
jgi:hypothetical protein